MVDFAKWCPVPVINALSDWSHPTQVLADVLTLREHWHDDGKGRRLVYVGDGNNVARSLASVCSVLGIKFTIASPEGYKLGPAEFARIRAEAGGRGDLTEVTDPKEAVRDADALYTDVWISMGQEAEQEKRIRDFQGYQINRELLGLAPKGTFVLHCLPAERGREITDDVMDDPEISAVFDEAENRFHIMRALMQEFVVNRRK